MAPAWAGNGRGDTARLGILPRPGRPCLPVAPLPLHAGAMFTVTEAEAAAIRRVFEQDGELSAMIELRRHFPGITDNTRARECARIIAGWTPPPVQPAPVTMLRRQRP